MYRGFGTKLTIVVDPDKRTVTMHESAGTTSFAEPEPATSAAYPDLRIDTVKLFTRL